MVHAAMVFKEHRPLPMGDRAETDGAAPLAGETAPSGAPYR